MLPISFGGHSQLLGWRPSLLGCEAHALLGWQAIALWVEGNIAIRHKEAIALRLEAIALRLEVHCY